MNICRVWLDFCHQTQSHISKVTLSCLLNLVTYIILQCSENSFLVLSNCPCTFVPYILIAGTTIFQVIQAHLKTAFGGHPFPVIPYGKSSDLPRVLTGRRLDLCHYCPKMEEVRKDEQEFRSQMVPSVEARGEATRTLIPHW